MAAFLLSCQDASGQGGVLIRADDEETAREKFVECNPEGRIESIKRVA